MSSILDVLVFHQNVVEMMIHDTDAIDLDSIQVFQDNS